jgi:ubiquinone/menaquinone biosynthesis C-methylase UbiE
MGGHIYFQTLSAAVQLDLFTILGQKGPLTRAQVATALGIAEKPARILLLGCAALGLVRKNRKGEYSNSRLSAELLDQKKPRHIVNIIKWQHYINYRAMFHFADALKANRNVGLDSISGQGATLYERLAQHPELEQIFQDAMQGISVQANHLLAEAVDFSKFTKVLDIGGGNATNIINLARQYPTLKAAVFDAPSVCAIAEDNIRNAGLEDRLGAVPGDCFRDAFPQGVDCILFAHFMTIWSEARNKELLTKAFHALPPGGAVIIFNMMQDDSETGPLSAALGSPYFLTLATGEGMLYTWSEYEQWMRESGFKTVIRHKLIRDHGVIIGIK